MNKISPDLSCFLNPPHTHSGGLPLSLSLFIYNWQADIGKLAGAQDARCMLKIARLSLEKALLSPYTLCIYGNVRHREELVARVKAAAASREINRPRCAAGIWEVPMCVCMCVNLE